MHDSADRELLSIFLQTYQFFLRLKNYLKVLHEKNVRCLLIIFWIKKIKETKFASLGILKFISASIMLNPLIRI